MAFVWGIDPGSVDILVGTNGREFVAELAIGYDDETDNTISAVVVLAPLPGGNYEHVFSIVDADPATTATTEYWDGAETANLFNKEDRETVLAIICSMTRALLGEIRPDCVLEFTHSTTLPAKALRKHQIVMGVFRNAGYSVRILPPHHGQQGWIAELN
jgi:hypothetical protein